MTLHKWGKFRSIEKKEYGLDTVKSNMRISRGRYGDTAAYGSYVITPQGKFSLDGYQQQYRLGSAAYLPASSEGPYSPGSSHPEYADCMFELTNVWSRHTEAYYWEGTLYGTRVRRIDYSKGSRLDTVTSSNRNAYPDNGQKDGYYYVYEGIANQTPTISGKDEDLGGFKAPFKRVFSVDDPDGNETLNVVVKLNSATIRTINNATKGESYEIDINKAKFDELELNKTNTIEITVSDSNGASAIRRYTFKKVNSNPVITVTNSNLGEQNKPFNFSFKANDPDGDDITVKVYVDDVQVQDLGKITPNQDKTVSIGKLDYAKLLNGEHRIKIEATDSFGAKGTGYITFTKKIDYCWYRLTKEVDAQPTAVVVNPLTELAKGAKMTVKVALNAKDANPTWEVVPEELIGQKYNFKTKAKTADKWCIGVDIRIDRADTPEGMESYFYGFVGAYM